MACPCPSPTAAANKFIVAGGTGFIGTKFCHLLKLKGYDYTIVSRMPGPLNMSWQELQKSGLPKNTRAVVNLAGQNVLDIKQRWTAGFKQNVWNSRVNTNCIIAEAIQKATKKPDVFLTISGVGIYKPDFETVYTEDTKPLHPYDFLSELCHEWENAAKLPSTVETRQIAVRSGVVLGREGGMIKQLYWPFFFGLGGPILPGDQYMPWIHVQDLCKLMLYAIENKRIKGILNGVAPQVVTNKEFSQAFAKALKRPAFIPVPKLALDILLSSERANMLTQGQKVEPKRTQSLGFDYIFPDINSACQGVLMNPKPPPF